MPYSTRQAAKKLGVDVATLSRLIKAKKVPTPKTVHLGGLRVHSWSETLLERVRKILPKIADGRKTRYKKDKAAQARKK